MAAPTLDELEAAGWSCVQVRCPGCRYSTLLGFNSRWVRASDTLRGLAGRLKCSRCRIRPRLEDVKAYYNAVPHSRSPPAPPGQEPSAADVEG